MQVTNKICRILKIYKNLQYSSNKTSDSGGEL